MNPVSINDQLTWLRSQQPSPERDYLIEQKLDELAELQGQGSTHVIRCNVNTAKAFYQFAEIQDKHQLVNQLHNILNHNI